MAELGKTQCESLTPRSCKNVGKYWIYRGDANRIVCPTHLARTIAHFTRPAVMWYPEYKVTDMSEVTVRVWNGTSWYPLPSRQDDYEEIWCTRCDRDNEHNFVDGKCLCCGKEKS